MFGRRLFIGSFGIVAVLLFGTLSTYDVSAHKYPGICPSERNIKACPTGYTDGYLYLPTGTVTCSFFSGAVPKVHVKYHDTTSHHNDLGGYCYKGPVGVSASSAGISILGNPTRYSSESACQQVACVPIPPKTPTLNVTANGTPGAVTIPYGTSATIEWTTTNVSSCVASGDWSGTKQSRGSYLTGILYLSKRYNFICTGTLGNLTVNKSIDVNVAAAPPTIVLKANNADSLSLAYNSSATLTWTSTSATSCTASSDPVGPWSGTKAVNGSDSTGSLTTTTVYFISCSGNGGNASDSVTVNVTLPPDPTVDIKANNERDKVSISYNTPATITWPTTDATSCWASGDWDGWKAIGESESTGNLIVPKTYSLQCWSASGVATDVVSVTVTPLPPDPTVDIKANNERDKVSISYNTPATITWPTTDATSCWASGDWDGWKAIGESESTGNLIVPKTYSLQCWSASGVATDVVSVTVTPLPPDPTVDIKANNERDKVSISYNTPATITWPTTDATSCWASGDWDGWKAIGESESTGNLIVPKTYSLQCWSASGVATDVVSVTVTPLPPDPTVDIKANNERDKVSISYNTPATITWPTTDATSCWASGDWDGWKAIGESESTGNLIVPKTYSLQCWSASGVATDVVSVTVTPLPPDPTVDIKANNERDKVSISYNTPATITWPTTDATSCWASGDWDGWKAIGESESTGNLIVPKTYSLQCWSASGVATDVVSVTVTPLPPDPTVDIKANNERDKVSISYNTPATITWPTTDATSCWASGDWDGWKAIGESESTGNLIVPKTYSLQCWSASGVATDVVSVTVTPLPPDPTVDIKANNERDKVSISYNTPATITWPTTDATSCWASGDWDGWKAIGESESTGNLIVPKTYSLQCWSASGVATDVVSVTVTPLPPDPTVDIKEFLLRLLSTHLGAPTLRIGLMLPAVLQQVDRPVAVAKFIVNGGLPSATITVKRGEQVDIALDASDSYHPAGWDNVSSGGQCAWNTALDQSKPPSFKKIIPNPTNPVACNISLGKLIFRNPLGTYTYTLLRITDRSGLSSIASALDQKTHGLFAKLFPFVSVASASFATASASVIVVE